MELAGAAANRGRRAGLEGLIQSTDRRDLSKPAQPAGRTVQRPPTRPAAPAPSPTALIPPAPESRIAATATAISDRERAIRQQNDDPVLARVRLERILQGNELSDINYLAQGVSCARSVCRIVLRSQGRLMGYGTGFLVAPGVLMTNHHVLSSVDDVVESVAQFRYERTIQGMEAAPVEFSLSTAPGPIFDRQLDFALVAVGGPTSSSGRHPSAAVHAEGATLDDFGWLRLNPQPGKAFLGEYLTIIQHPNGSESKSASARTGSSNTTPPAPMSGTRRIPSGVLPARRCSTTPGTSLRSITAECRKPSK